MAPVDNYIALRTRLKEMCRVRIPNYPLRQRLVFRPARFDQRTSCRRDLPIRLLKKAFEQKRFARPKASCWPGTRPPRMAQGKASSHGDPQTSDHLIISPWVRGEQRFISSNNSFSRTAFGKFGASWCAAANVCDGSDFIHFAERPGGRLRANST